MWLSLILLVGLFLAMMVSLYLEFDAREKERARPAEVELAGPARPGHCILCGAPLRRERTTAEVVFEVEHRIDTELQDISHLLRTAPEKVSRLYLA